MQKNNPIKLNGVLVILFGMLVSFSAMAQPAGRLLFAKGDVQLERINEEPRKAKRGDAVEVGDTLRTGAKATAQLRLSDGAMIALKPASVFRLDEQNYDKANPEKSSQTGKLLRGGLRAITGAIGKDRPGAVKLSTPVATIGIRGTVYDLVYVPPGGLSGYPDVAPGHYTMVLQGRVTIGNGVGSLELGVGEIGFIADADTPPALRPDLSWLFARYTTLHGSDDYYVEEIAENIDEVLAETAAQHSAVVKPGPYALVIGQDWMTSTVYKGTFVANDVSVGGKGELVYADGGTYGNVAQFDATSSSYGVYGPGSYTAGDSTINWGSYDATMDTAVTIYDSSGQPLDTTNVYSLNFITATNVIIDFGDLPTTGSFTYNYVGGSGAWLMDSSNLVVDFGSATMSVNLYMDGPAYTATDAPIADFYRDGVILTDGAAASGTINGRFVGSNAEGAITSFEFDTYGEGVGTFAR